MRRTHHVWLPSLRVWAQASVAEDVSCSSRNRARHGIVHQPCDTHPGNKHRRDRGHFDVAHPPEDCDHCYDQESKQTCPICLSPISQANLSMLQWCMHQFCISCIEKWSCMQRFCPLCKQTFQGWYYNIKSASEYDEKDLMAMPSKQTSGQLHVQRRRERCPFSRVERTHPPVGRSRPLPWRRIFGNSQRILRSQPQGASESEVYERALRWRASIYRNRLRAVPLHVIGSIKLKEAPGNDPERKARIERRMEPWICRELQALMGDSDVSLLVHLVLSLWLNVLAERERRVKLRRGGGPSGARNGYGDGEVDAVRQLQPFLYEDAPAFWHELRCFAESPYTFRAYDSIVRYEKDR